MYIRNGLMISLNLPIELDGVTYPAPIQPHWFALLGITEVADPQQPDPNLYDSTRNPDGTWSATEKPLSEIKAWRKRVFRSQASDLFETKYDLLTSILVLAGQTPAGFSNTYKSDIKSIVDAYQAAANQVDAATFSNIMTITPAWPTL